eukprot:783547-Prorocentrum_lima.AAC.1
MTSSLVGSEMCIRDSSTSGQVREENPPAGPRPWPHPPCSSWREAHPVSYTHLTLPTICSV